MNQTSSNRANNLVKCNRLVKSVLYIVSQSKILASGQMLPVAAGALLLTLRRPVQKIPRGCCSQGSISPGCNTKIHRCLERANQLLSLLVPVSDINRAAAGMVAAHRAVASAKQSLAANYYG
jgi:hypothetical protein